MRAWAQTFPYRFASSLDKKMALCSVCCCDVKSDSQKEISKDVKDRH